jgi:hypothetical protein
MQIDKKYFVSSDSLLDSDSADFVVSQNAWVNMENFRTGTTDKGVIGTVESINGTSLVSSQEEEYIAIGSCSDEENQRFITFYYSPTGNHKIECCYSNTNTIYSVLKSADVTGGLNFTKEPIHSSAIISNLLSWVDGTNNEPRKINIESGMKAYDSNFETTAHPYSFPLNFDEITLIKKPAPLSPNILKKTNTAFLNNFIANESFQFAFQYVYYDNETSVTGTYSEATRLNYSTDTSNYVSIKMDPLEYIPDTVKLINLIARTQTGVGDGGTNAAVIKTWDKSIQSELEEIIEQNRTYSQLSFDFYNNITGQILASDDVLRPFDNVPVYSQAIEASKNRVFLGNNIVGYDTPKTTSLGGALTNLINIGASYQPITAYMFYAGWARAGGYELQYYTYIINYNNAYYSILSCESNTNFINPPNPIVFSNLVYAGANEIEIVKNFLIRSGIPDFRLPTDWQNGDTYGFQFPPYGELYYTSIETIGGAYNVLPQRSVYKLGIVFYDYAMRKCGVVNKTTNIQLASISSFDASGGFSAIAATKTFIIQDPIAYSIQPLDIIKITNSYTNNGEFTVRSISNNTTYLCPEVVVYETITDTSGGFEPGTFEIGRGYSLDISTPSRNYNYTYAYGGVQWSLSNDNAVSEIPKWAYYYSVVKTLNLRTRFLIQSYSDSLKYATKDINGNWSFDVTSPSYSPIAAGIGINTNALSYSGLGYAYSEGDICILTKENNTVYEIPVIAQVGSYIILKSVDIGILTNKKFCYEIYSPYQTSEQEPYYEIGELYEITSPTNENRVYSTLNGIIPSDSYVIPRQFRDISYFSNAMCPNDLFYKRWDTDAGKPNFITKIGQQGDTISIYWSDTYVSGTKINGTSTFRLGSNTWVPVDCGAISKLILTSKVQEQGTVMLGICTNETNSMYLGETQITDSTGKVQFFGANSSQVISTINTLKGSFGTINPEAVVEFRGNVFYPDANKGVWVQYSSNGLYPISNYKTTRFWKLFFKQYLSMTKAEIEALGGRPYIFTAVDNSHLELLISIPKLLEIPPKGYLPDYPDKVYPFDIWDGQGKTIVFCLDNPTQQAHWQGSYSFNPELFTTIGNNLYSNKNGNLWQHNIYGSYGIFYDEYYPSRIMFISNQLPQSPKVYNNIKVHSSQKPDFTYFYNDFPYLQTSDLVQDDYRDFEGVYYASLYRNKMVPHTQSGREGIVYTSDGLLTFEKMRNVAMKIMLEFGALNKPIELKFVELGFDISSNSPS